jgi:acetyltransferase-like isoleucine patch superfamily enzyme
MKNIFLIFFKFIIIFFPWFLRRRILENFFKYKIHPKSKIGYSWIYPKFIEMSEGAVIEHLNVAINLDKIYLGKNSIIGRNNWITGFPTKTNSLHFYHQTNRVSELIVGENSAITKNHHIDCTNSIKIGDFVTIAGYQSQLLTHSINVFENRQDSAPIVIGNYCFVGTNVVILGGAILPSYSILGAKSLLNKSYADEWTLYAGVPAKFVKGIDKKAKYFNRNSGFVH